MNIASIKIAPSKQKDVLLTFEHFPRPTTNRQSPQLPLHIRVSTPSDFNLPPPSTTTMVNSRRVLRPRTEPRSYVESPDALINGSLDRRLNGGGIEFGDSDSSEGEMPPLPPPIKELTPDELKQRYVYVLDMLLPVT